jgi:hypothetical protein
LSDPRTTVDQTEAEAWESERNRVAWNLPRGVGPVPSKPPHETAKKPRQLTDATDQVAKDG